MGPNSTDHTQHTDLTPEPESRAAQLTTGTYTEQRRERRRTLAHDVVDLAFEMKLAPHQAETLTQLIIDALEAVEEEARGELAPLLRRAVGIAHEVDRLRAETAAVLDAYVGLGEAVVVRRPAVVKWPAFVVLGSRFTTEGARAGNPSIGDVVRVVSFTGDGYAVCFDERGQEFHFAPWQFDGPMRQLRRTDT